jgi:hypothetical protein
MFDSLWHVAADCYIVGSHPCTPTEEYKKSSDMSGAVKHESALPCLVNAALPGEWIPAVLLALLAMLLPSSRSLLMVM